MNVEICLVEVSFLVFQTLKLSHLVSLLSNLVWIVNRICLLYSKSTNFSKNDTFFAQIMFYNIPKSP